MAPGRYIRMIISWLSRILKKTTLRSYRTLLAVFRLFQYHGDPSGMGAEERGLALGSQSPQLTITAATLAVPVSPQSKGSQPGSSIQFPTPKQVSRIGLDIDNLLEFWEELDDPLPVAPDFRPIPIIPEQIRRYERNKFIKGVVSPLQVEKGPLDYSEDDAPVNKWLPFTHPEGALFFYHPYKRLFTDVNIRDLDMAKKVDRAAKMAYEAARRLEDGLGNLGYYFADHDKNIIFWPEDHTSPSLMNNVRGVERKSHLRYALESQYWEHVELFPNKRCLPRDVVENLNEMVMHALAENVTSGLCLAPFGSDEVANMLTLIDPLTKSIGKEREHSVWIVARFMRLLYNAKFVNFCGQPGARLQADQSLYGDPNTYPKNLFLRVMNFVLFGSPDGKSKAIHRIWVDDTIVEPRWKNFIDKLNSEWNGYTMFSTVMLAVDVSFLAVPSVGGQTAAILVAYLSTFCAMGSLVVSLVLARQINDTRRDNAKDVGSFMFEMSQSTFGLEGLALMFSLPFALLIWGMISFGVAFSIIVFHTSSKVTITTAALVLAAVFILAIWPIMTANNVHLTSMKRRILDQLVYEEPTREETSIA